MGEKRRSGRRALRNRAEVAEPAGAWSRRGHRAGRSILSLLVVFLGGAATAWGQAEVRNPIQPLLVLDTGGHSGPVRSLLFTPDGGQLLSAGLDKVVRVWNLDPNDRGLARTIRPPRWRGLSGGILTMALSPRVDAEGQRLLAVAGLGVQSSFGNILLYRYPGRDPGNTGEVAVMIPARGANDPAAAGHFDTVQRLEFSPDGRYLASAGFDGTVRIWDATTSRQVAVLNGHGGRPVTGLAYTAGGRRIVTGGFDGQAVLWDVAPERLDALDRQLAGLADAAARQAALEAFGRASELARARPQAGDANPADPNGGLGVNALVVSPDGRWLVVGRENGRVILYDATTLAVRSWPLEIGQAAAIEALAISPDSTRVAVSRLARKIDQPEQRPPVANEVGVYTLPEFQPVGRRMLDNRVHALSFSPDGRSLALAGGDAQGVYLCEAGNPAQLTASFEGQGRSVWDVGFDAAGERVAYAMVPDDAPAAPARLWGYHLKEREVVGLDRQATRRGETTHEGYSVRAVNLNTLRVRDPQGAEVDIALDRSDVRWWDFAFLPPTPEHPRLGVAVATESCVAVYARQDDGSFVRTREFNGHEASVYAVAPSPDGRWLATGSADQTVRLWRLAGCDRLPPFGATFAPGEGGKPAVQAVAELSFAEAAGLKAGDVVEELYLDAKPRDPARDLGEIETLPPGRRIEMRVRRGEQLVGIGNTRRDSPSLTLYVGADREWVVWTPRGHYETSIAGDRRHLGWHRNGIAAGGQQVDLLASTDYFTIDRFENELRRPDVLDRLIATGDLAQSLQPLAAAARAPEPLVRQDAPPRVELVVPNRPAAGRVVLADTQLAFAARVLTDDLGAARHALRSIRVRVNGQLQRVLENLNQPEQAVPVQATLPMGESVVTVEAVSDTGRERSVSFPVEVRPQAPPPPPARAARLLAIAVGVDRFQGQPALPGIPFASEDARDVMRFVTDPAFQKFGTVESPTVLTGREATAAKFREALQALDRERDAGRIGPGDTVCVWIETHLLSAGREDGLLLSDASGSLPSEPSVAASDVAEILGKLPDYGCRVVVLLDGVHEAKGAPAGWKSRTAALARELTRRNVVVFVASVQGPGLRLPTEGHGAFAQAVITARDVRSQVRLATASDVAEPWTIDRFRDTVERSVGRLTGLKQVARCYVPGTLHPRTNLFAPEGSSEGVSGR